MLTQTSGTKPVTVWDGIRYNINMNKVNEINKQSSRDPPEKKFPKWERKGFP